MKTFINEVAKNCDIELSYLLNCYSYTVYSSVAVAIEGHKGIIKFTQENIVFNVDKKNLSITGENLKIKLLDKNYALIVGRKIEVQLC